MKRRRKLNYPFAPPPRWLIEAWMHGEMSDEAMHVHLVLYHRASSTALADRRELLPMRLDALARDLRRPADKTLTKLLWREQKRGRLTYRVEGSPRTGHTYIFRLFPDGPCLSEKGRPKSDGAGLPIELPRARTGTAIAVDASEGAIPQTTERPDAELSPEGGDLSPDQADAGTERKRNSAPPRSQPVAQLETLRDKANLGSEENLLGEESEDWFEPDDEPVPPLDAFEPDVKAAILKARAAQEEHADARVREQAVLAEVDELVAEGLATWEDEQDRTREA